MSRTGVDTEEPDEQPEALALWLAAGFGREEAEVWRGWRFTIARAQAWRTQGIDEGIEAAQWQTAGVTPERLRDWHAAGVTDASEAVRWHEMGFSLDEARQHKRQGRDPAAAFQASHPQPRNVVGGVVRSGWVSVGPGFAPGGPVQHPFHVFQQAGVDPRTMQGYLQRGWMDDDAVEWARQGIEAQDAYVWYDLGLRAVEAGRMVLQGRTPGDVVREWWSAGVPFEEAAEWIGAGLSASEAVEQRAQGITVEHAASLRALRLGEAQPPKDPIPHALLARMGPPRAQMCGPPPDNEPSARAAVEQAYADMMTADEQGNVEAVEGGSNLGGCLEEARERHGVVVSAGAPGATVKADMIRFVNDHEARVLFTISIGPPINQNFGGRIGRATCLDGQWKVARDTFCEFMQMAGVQCPPAPR